MGGLGGALRTGEKPECCFCCGLGGDGTREGLSAAIGGKSVGCGWWPLRRFIGAVFWRKRPGRLGALKGSGRPTGGRVGEGRSGSISSSSSTIIEERGENVCGASRCFCAATAANMFLLLGIVGALAATVRRGDRERQAMDMGDGSTIWTSMGESNCVRARESGPRVRFLGGVLDSTTGGESKERLLRSVIDGKSVSAAVLTDEYWRSGEGNAVVSLEMSCEPSCETFCDARRCCTSASTCFRTSALNIACSFCLSISTCRSISSRAFTSHSRRMVDSRAALILSFSLFRFETFASASCAFSIICSSLVLSIRPNSTTSLSFLISRTAGMFRRLAVSGRFRGLTLKQLLTTFCNSCEYIGGSGSMRPSLIFWIRWKCVFALNGWVLAHNSYMTQPKDQISEWRVYRSAAHISGDI